MLISEHPDLPEAVPAVWFDDDRGQTHLHLRPGLPDDLVAHLEAAALADR